MYDVAIIGCGVVGAAAAFELSKYKLNIAVLEKENDVALGASRANSAIVHAGYDPEPGTLMARLNVQGCAMAEQLCKDLSVPYEKIGSLVLAFSESERKTVNKLYDRGVKNGVPDMQILSREEVLQMEPEVSPEVMGALYAPSAGIIGPWEYTVALAEVAVQNGAEMKLRTKVEGIDWTEEHYVIHTNKGNVEAKYIVNAAGVHSGEIHEMVAEKSFEIRPNRGEYYVLDKCEVTKARHTLFQCPNENGKGVLVSPTVGGNLIVGPNAEGVSGEEDNHNTAAGMAFVQRMAAKSVPNINYRHSIRNFAGVRANLNKDEFQIGVAAKQFIDLAGIKSPGLTSAPAIALECIHLLQGEGLSMEQKENPITTRKKIHFRSLSAEDKQQVIKENPLYGRVICRCETITEGEIVDAIHSPIPPCSIDGIKRRAGSGLGRCQGGFCGPRVLDILARELKVSPLDILQDKDGSFILMNETKKEV
ncbi:MAG: FAD-dependent oxidoreductase [Clostridia bacterium]|nr:FAD-dependent oxidoreductase [Clostridia bacterium]